ncbi:GGDEF domain-containing protein [Rhizobium sp. RAF56]|jgi:diguanylate cyclase (GGDEF)-like protein|uniref:GGDEF domain-containing protein n=1 Tax=Rhizobium sp. RAF56 TaxID=3233062 RepID=UPI003F9A6197
MMEAQAHGASADLRKVGLHMTKLKVTGLPRNYQLFHEALFGHNRSIGAEIAALGPNPSQAMLDDIGLKYHLVSHCGLVAEKSQADAVRMLRDVAEQLAESLKKKQSFARTVQTVTHSVSGDHAQSFANFTAEMDFLNASLTNLMLYETELTEKLRNEMEKLETLERDANAARTAAATDRITGLPNQIALINRLTELYEGAESPGTALILVDIDDFRAFNSKYGPQPANLLLKKLGALFRKTIKKDDFVARMSNDDFGFVFSNVGLDVARTIAVRLRASVEGTMVYSTSDKSDPGRVTISVGIALCSDASSPAQLLASAQSALATAQSNRRQPVQIYARAS